MYIESFLIYHLAGARQIKSQHWQVALYALILTGIVHAKIKICWKVTHDEFVSSWEQIGDGINVAYITF